MNLKIHLRLDLQNDQTGRIDAEVLDIDHLLPVDGDGRSVDMELHITGDLFCLSMQSLG